MNRLLFLLILVTSLAGKVQGQPTHDSVALYYQLKNKAELAIIDSNYTTALELYAKAMATKRPNARELYNALVAAYISHNEILADRYFDLLALHGMNKAAFELDYNFGRVIAEEPLYKKISGDYDSLKAIADRTDMPVVGKVLDSLHKADQAVRSEDSRKIAGVDSANRQFLLRYIMEKGFPGFSRAGFYDPGLAGASPHGPGVFWFIMWHARYGGGTVLDSVVLQAVRDGDFPPEDYALLMDVYKDDNRFYYEIMPHKVVDGKTVLLLPAEREIIDQRRATIYLDNLEDYKRKLEYMEYGDRRFTFLPVMGFSMIFAK